MSYGVDGASRRRQRGWIGLVGLLLALAMVALLAKTVLQQAGLSGLAGPASKATPVGSASHEVTATEPTPRNAIERARGLESAVQQQAVDNAKRIDDVLKR
jgi:hypothetical protein